MKKGFTLVELIVVLGVIGLMTVIFLPNLLGSRSHVEVRSNAYTVVADIKAQQLKAMLGDTEGRGINSPYGVHFETTTYTLFHGDTYSPAEPSNAIIALAGDLHFNNVSFPSSTIVFQKGNGEIFGFVSGGNGFSLTVGSTGEVINVSFNQLGIVSVIE